MSKERIGLSYFEAVMHKRFVKVTLVSELRDCFNYFEHVGQAKNLGKTEIMSIHGIGIEIRKVEEGKGYAVEVAGNVKTVGVDNISRSEQVEIVRKIRKITIPYAEYVKTEYRKH